MQIAILGRQPKISLAELEVLFGSENIVPIESYAALVNTASALPQQRLGGTIKSAEILARIESGSLEDAFAHLRQYIPEYIAYLPEGKLQLGVSVYGFKAQKNWLLRQMLELKKIVRKEKRSVRIIENKSEALEAAQVLYNKLTGELGREFLFVKDGASVIIAQTTGIQNIDDYAARDFERPMRDAYVGMLPPKLAQIMINLVIPAPKATILDPFCGTGVILQEANLMDLDAYGTDIEPRMVEYSQQNLKWLTNSGKFTPPPSGFRVEVGDATQYQWPHHFDAVVCETYLGKPLTQLPNESELIKITSEADYIAGKFLENIASQIKKGTRLSIALPAWHLKDKQFKHLKTLDHLTDLGYNRLDLVHASKQDLIYHRENQVVARELTILEKA